MQTKHEPPPAKAAISLGSNLGESPTILEKALQTLEQTSGIIIENISNWYETVPVGPAQPNYINGCAILQTELSPENLLSILLEIEIKFGRVRAERWGARTLDLDLILYENLILNTPQLQIPHPRMSERAFVLLPLAEIAPNWIEPVTGKTIAELLKKIDISGILKKIELKPKT